MTLKFEELRSREGYDPQKESPKFGPLWRGGEWHLSNITKYMTTAAFPLVGPRGDESRVSGCNGFMRSERKQCGRADPVSSMVF